MLAIVRAAHTVGVTGHPVTVECHAGPGLPSFTIVGQADATCREARDRVRAAVLNSEMSWPNSRITVNLAPAGERKIGSILDLPIALAVLAATEVIPPLPAPALFSALGELGLDGSVRMVAGLLPAIDAVSAGSERGSVMVRPYLVPPKRAAEVDEGSVPGEPIESLSAAIDLLARLEIPA